MPNEEGTQRLYMRRVHSLAKHYTSYSCQVKSPVILHHLYRGREATVFFCSSSRMCISILLFHSLSLSSSFSFLHLFSSLLSMLSILFFKSRTSLSNSSYFTNQIHYTLPSPCTSDTIASQVCPKLGVGCKHSQQHTHKTTITYQLIPHTTLPLLFSFIQYPFSSALSKRRLFVALLLRALFTAVGASLSARLS